MSDQHADYVRDHEGSICWCLTSEQPFYECVRATQNAESVAKWERIFGFCMGCQMRRLMWVKGNVGHCDLCRSDWHPPEHSDGDVSP